MTTKERPYVDTPLIAHAPKHLIHPVRVTEKQRFWDKVQKTEACWLWTGARITAGYGSFWDGANTVYAHRFSYELHREKIPPGLVIDHICRVKSCVNPDHLRAVTVRTNALENNSGPVARNAQKTHCYEGHALHGENLRVDGRGRRECRTCRARASEIRNARNVVCRQPEVVALRSAIAASPLTGKDYALQTFGVAKTTLANWMRSSVKIPDHVLNVIGFRKANA